MNDGPTPVDLSQADQPDILPIPDTADAGLVETPEQAKPVAKKPRKPRKPKVEKPAPAEPVAEDGQA